MEPRTRMNMDFLNLPLVVLENIFSYMTFDEIAKSRIICRLFNEMCQRLLNHGFVMIERRHALALKNVKAQLPRRESERRYHPLSRHCDILSSIETRISMLNMTYSKFIDSGMCCFIPGKVIDEINRVLLLVEKSTTPPRAHEVLQELRDISSMAIEHFDDKISPEFRRLMQENAAAASRNVPRHEHVFGPLALKQELFHIRRRSLVNSRLSLHLASQFKKFYKQMQSYKRIAIKQRKVIRNMNQRHNEQESSIADLKKRIEECDIRYSELTHTNQPGKAIASAPGPASAPTQPLRHFASQIKLDLSVLPIGTSKRNQRGSNIKPRKPSIRLPSLSEDQPETEESTQNKTEKSNTGKKTQCSLTKIQTNEQELKNLNKSELLMRSGKRSLRLNPFDEEPSKKMKMD